MQQNKTIYTTITFNICDFVIIVNRRYASYCRPIHFYTSFPFSLLSLV